MFLKVLRWLCQFEPGIMIVVSLITIPPTNFIAVCENYQSGGSLVVLTKKLNLQPKAPVKEIILAISKNIDLF